MKVKGDAKFKGKLTRDFKNDTKNLVNFHASSCYSENLHFPALLLSKVYSNLGENVQKNCAKFEEKLTLGSKFERRSFVNFNESSGKSENLQFEVLLLSIAYKV